jgi:hypothetical protein
MSEKNVSAAYAKGGELINWGKKKTDDRENHRLYFHPGA